MSVTSSSTIDPALQRWRDRVKDRTLIPSLEFDPPPAIAEQIISGIADPDESIGSVAAKAHTSIEALTLWLTKPDIAARLDAMESVIARKARLDVASYTGAIVHACSTAIKYYAEAMNHRHVADHDHRGHDILVREASNALLASRILLHLRKHYAEASPRPPRQSPAPLPSSPSPAPAHTPTPPSSTESHGGRFTILPPLPDLTFNLHDARESNHTTPNNPARNNAAAAVRAPAVTVGGSGPQGPIELPLAPAPPNVASQAESLTGNSRGLSESASATPGKQRTKSSHPVRVQPATPDKPPCACHSKSRTKNACATCVPTTTLLTIAGTTTNRPRETPKPTV